MVGFGMGTISIPRPTVPVLKDPYLMGVPNENPIMSI